MNGNLGTTTAHVLLFRNNEVLLVRHGTSAGHMTGVYGIPGGHVDGEETLKEAAIRELREETGLIAEVNDLREFSDNQYTADITRKTGEIKRYTMIIFLAQVFSGEIRGTTETTPEWVSIEDLGKFTLLPNVKNAIFAAKKFLDNEILKN